jgi:hypothetical protein
MSQRSCERIETTFEQFEAYLDSCIENEEALVDRLRNNIFHLKKVLKVQNELSSHQSEDQMNSVESELKSSILQASQSNDSTQHNGGKSESYEIGLPEKLDQILAVAQRTRETSNKMIGGNGLNSQSKKQQSLEQIKTTKDSKYEHRKPLSYYQQKKSQKIGGNKAGIQEMNQQQNIRNNQISSKGNEIVIKTVEKTSSERVTKILISQRLIRSFDEQMRFLRRFHFKSKVYKTLSSEQDKLITAQLLIFKKASILIPWSGSIDLFHSMNRPIFEYVLQQIYEMLKIWSQNDGRITVELVGCIKRDIIQLKAALSPFAKSNSTAVSRLHGNLILQYLIAFLKVKIWQILLGMMCAIGSNITVIFSPKSENQLLKEMIETFYLFPDISKITDWNDFENKQNLLSTMEQKFLRAQRFVERLLLQKLFTHFIKSQNIIYRCLQDFSPPTNPINWELVIKICKIMSLIVNNLENKRARPIIFVKK